MNAEERIINLEYDLFIEIRETIKKYIPKLQNISKTISEIDVLQSLSTVAEENNFVRPDIIEERKIELIGKKEITLITCANYGKQMLIVKAREIK